MTRHTGNDPNDTHGPAAGDGTVEPVRVGVFRDRAAYLRWEALNADTVLLVSPIGDPVPVRMPEDARMLIVDALDLDADGTVLLFAGHWLNSRDAEHGGHIAVRLDPPHDTDPAAADLVDVALLAVINNEIRAPLATWSGLDAGWPSVVAPVAAAAFAGIHIVESIGPEERTTTQADHARSPEIAR